ncbi:MAG: hypothetical protein V9G08_10660 [Dermatophilaceae bacterium]
MQRPDHLVQPGGAGAGLEVADVGLHRPQGDGAFRGTGGAEDLGEGLELGGVADAGRGPVRLDGRDGGRVDPGPFPATGHGELLADRVGRGDALALAVGGPADPEDRRVDRVAVALGVVEALEDEQGRALAHDESVGARVERAGAGRRQRPDLAELDERVDAHVPVDRRR